MKFKKLKTPQTTDYQMQRQIKAYSIGLIEDEDLKASTEYGKE